MLYAVVSAKKAEEKGFLPVIHRMFDNDRQMVLNENELRAINNDIGAVAEELGGKIVTYTEMMNIIKQYKNSNDE